MKTFEKHIIIFFNTLNDKTFNHKYYLKDLKKSYNKIIISNTNELIINSKEYHNIISYMNSSFLLFLEDYFNTYKEDIMIEYLDYNYYIKYSKQQFKDYIKYYIKLYGSSLEEKGIRGE